MRRSAPDACLRYALCTPTCTQVHTSRILVVVLAAAVATLAVLTCSSATLASGAAAAAGTYWLLVRGQGKDPNGDHNRTSPLHHPVSPVVAGRPRRTAAARLVAPPAQGAAVVALSAAAAATPDLLPHPVSVAGRDSACATSPPGTLPQPAAPSVEGTDAGRAVSTASTASVAFGGMAKVVRDPEPSAAGLAVPARLRPLHVRASHRYHTTHTTYATHTTTTHTTPTTTTHTTHTTTTHTTHTTHTTTTHTTHATTHTTLSRT
jgi:hypothetical protein